MSTRVCTWCHGEVPGFPAGCPVCEERLAANLPDPATMTLDERIAELEMLNATHLEVRFTVLHGRVEALAGRPVWTHEFAAYPNIIAQVRAARGPTVDEWLGPLVNKQVIVVSLDEPAQWPDPAPSSILTNGGDLE